MTWYLSGLVTTNGIEIPFQGKDADPGLPEVEDAKKRLAGLKWQYIIHIFNFGEFVRPVASLGNICENISMDPEKIKRLERNGILVAKRENQKG